MAEDFRSQARRMDALARERVDLCVRTLVSEADKRLREKTPVRTGYARGNWNIATGSPDDTVAERFEGEGPAAPREFSGGAGDVFYLTNAVPYIEALEHGHSKQAPAGMAGITAPELRLLAEQIAVKVQQVDRGQ